MSTIMTKPPGPRELQLRQQREEQYEESQKRIRALAKASKQTDKAKLVVKPKKGKDHG